MSNEFNTYSGASDGGLITLAKIHDNRLDPLVDSKIARIQSAQAPLDTILRAAGTGEMVGGESWQTQEAAPLPDHYLSQAAESNTAATDLTFRSTRGVIRGSVLMNTRTKEQIRVGDGSTINNTTGAVSDIKRGFANTVARAIVAHDIWIDLGARPSEAGSLPDPVGGSSGSLVHRTGMIHHSFSLSTHALNRLYRGETEFSFQEELAIGAFRLKRNRHLIFGSGVLDTTTETNPISQTHGLYHRAKQYLRYYGGGGFSLDTFRYALEAYNAATGAMVSNVWGLTSRDVISQVQNLERNRRVLNYDATTLGMKVGNFDFNGGTFKFLVDDALNFRGFNNIMILFTMDNLTIRPFMTLSMIEQGPKELDRYMVKVTMFVNEGLQIDSPRRLMLIDELNHAVY